MADTNHGRESPKSLEKGGFLSTMSRRDKFIFFIFGFFAGILLTNATSAFVFQTAVVPVFSPEDGAEIIHFIDEAESTIDIQMFAFTSHDVVEALERANERGVKVRVILERDVNDNADTLSELAAEGLLVRYAGGDFRRTHSKFIIRDEREVLVGSHNFSNSALFHNREASVIISGPAVQEFIEIFEHDWNLA
ncbi:TPA: DUF1669 domain-containing protein [Candidatus Micrarchaeota archaeon]|nr:DUF1669 domain-containing protein [Candidatus Micrarchaeota archaeon]